jgi:23S rRNA pseudouridine1911/1915/1917 synthase
LAPEIIYEDQHLIVLSKPAGLLSQGDKSGDASVIEWLRQYFGRAYVGLVHRLDRNTSGLMVVAKRSKAAARLTRALQEGEIVRAYLAWLTGSLPANVSWRHWLVKDEARNLVRVAARGTRGAKEAVLAGRALARGVWDGRALTLMEFILDTGRSHQIRVQAAAEGHPLLGDPKYGPQAARAHGRPFGRPALHSARLEFPHPMSGERLCFEAPMPKDMRAAVQDCPSKPASGQARIRAKSKSNGGGGRP